MNRSSQSLCSHGEAAEDHNVTAEWTWKGAVRGLLWRFKLGVLPSSSSSIDEVRRAAAEGRRRYAELRRRLLVDPHAKEDTRDSRHLKVDNPLSQDPESIWSRYFQIAELEEMIDTDLSRLYPEYEQFFQSPVCQAMLRRILLVWSLMNSSHSYRQGMHELLAPLLYVLHCDVMHLCEIKQRYEDLFDDRFEEPSYLELKAYENRRKQGAPRLPCSKTAITSDGSEINVDVSLLERITYYDSMNLTVDDIDCGLRIMVLGNDIYGAEGELGELLSGRFLEHDAYSMFDALMSRNGVNMADYFVASNGITSTSGLSPALEAASLLFKALAVFDSPLYNHLKGLGVQPQFFSLRWIRVLFGREFDLENLMILWDTIFSVGENFDAADNSTTSPRRDFILAVSLSMVIYLRLILLATSNATDCLQRLLNFPQNVDVKILIDSAKVLVPFVGEITSGRYHSYTQETVVTRKSEMINTSPVSANSSPKHISIDVFQKAFPESYWEEKWKKNYVMKKLKAMDLEALKNSEISKNSLWEPKKQISTDGITRMQDKYIHAEDVISCESTKVENIAHGSMSKPSEAMYRASRGDACMIVSKGFQKKNHDMAVKSDQSLGNRSPENVIFMPPTYEKTVVNSVGQHTPCGRSGNHRSLDVPSDISKPKNFTNSKKNWLWSFSKGKNQDDNKLDEMITIRSKEAKSTLSGKEPNIQNSVIGKPSIMAALETDDGAYGYSSGENRLAPTGLKVLGQAIWKNVQVIENALSRVYISEDTQVLEDDVNGIPITNINASRYGAVQAALTELKRISNSLLQI